MKKQTKTKRETKQIVEVHIYIHQNQPDTIQPVFPPWSGAIIDKGILGEVKSKPCPDNLPGCLVAHC